MPYTYYLEWKDGKKYYGVRYAKGSDVSDLWNTYFTSSKIVKHHREKYGEPHTILIDKIFENADEALDYEERYLKSVNAANSDDWLNQSNGRKNFRTYSGPENHNYGKRHSQELRIRMGLPKKGKFAGNKNPNYGKKHSDRVKDIISARNSGKRNGRHVKTIYKFIHETHGEFIGTKYDFRIRYKIDLSSVNKLISGFYKSTHGWVYGGEYGN